MLPNQQQAWEGEGRHGWGPLLATCMYTILQHLQLRDSTGPMLPVHQYANFCCLYSRIHDTDCRLHM